MRPVLLSPGAPTEPGWVRAGSAAEVTELALRGATVLVTLPADPDAALAAASIYRWLGACVFVTEHIDQVRLALDMTDSLAGHRPPTLTRRGLA